MTIAHHPAAETLAAFAAGTLDEGRSLVVATHLALCPACRREVGIFESIGGAVLDELPASPLQGDALRRTMERLEPPRGLEKPSFRGAPIDLYRLGPWRRLGIGVFWREVAMAPGPTSRVFLLKAAGGTKLPAHSHSGTELTCVLQGAFSHALGRYGRGDVDDADETVDHDPFVEPGEACVCLVAMQGELKLHGLVGKLVQPLVRLMARPTA